MVGMTGDPELREHLRQLHEELDATESVDADAHELLNHLLNDIRSLLDRSTEESQHTPHSLAERLETATRDFETSHPTLYTTVGRLMDALSNMGI